MVLLIMSDARPWSISNKRGENEDAVGELREAIGRVAENQERQCKSLSSCGTVCRSKSVRDVEAVRLTVRFECRYGLICFTFDSAGMRLPRLVDGGCEQAMI